jgi:hypothetical protein
MPRYFSVQFTAVAVTVAQDLFEVIAGTKPLTLCEVVTGQSSDYGDSAAEGLQLTIKRGIGNTAGSAGSAVTPVAHNTGLAAATATAKVNNTTQATAGTGSLTTLRSETFNVQGGYQYLPPVDQRPVILPSQSCVVAVSAPADSLTMSATLVFCED